MSPPISAYFSVREIPGAGRGVIADDLIPKNTLLLQSAAPAAHVVFAEYRKEVCALCFHYDRGRTLPVRLNSIGKVFCSPACLETWSQEQGELGAKAWEALHQFVLSKSKAISNEHGLPFHGPRPGAEEIKGAWVTAGSIGQDLKVYRISKPTSHNKKQKDLLPQGNTRAVDPDLLGFLLSGILFHHHHPNEWRTDILTLAQDAQPYKSSIDLQAHCDSFLQLTAVLPLELLPSATTKVCQTILNAASHNAFGIRCGSEDGDEYMGYGVYPEASYFNHSCTPNIAKRRVGRRWEFRAMRDIGVGQECCISYFGGDERDLNVTERRGRSMEFWGFACMCERCRLESGSE